ncbi:MAG: hypothetical protein AB1717_10600 [Pseudomonadota bacterium]
MNKNAVCAQLEFSFKGETYLLEEMIDLDSFFIEQRQLAAGETPDFHRYLAKKASIDPISYLYEVLESHEISFSQASGLAADFCQNAAFDWQGFVEARRAAGEWENILAIVQDKITPQALEADDGLKAALLAVYRAGVAGVR